MPKDWVSLGVGASSALLTAATLLVARGMGSPVDWSVCAAGAAAAGLAAVLGHAALRRIAGSWGGATGSVARRSQAREGLGLEGLGLEGVGLGAKDVEAGRLQLRLRLAELEREHVESIFAQLDDAVVVTDSAGELISVNAAAAQVLRLSLPDAVGRPLAQVVREPALVELIEQARHGDEARPLRRELVLSHGPTPGRFDVTALRLAGVGAEPAGVATVMHDLSRDARLTQMRDDFISNVSHELRTPLASIKAYIELLIDGEVQDERVRAEFYGIIHNEANRLTRLVENILTINRIETGLAKVDRQRLSLSSVVREAVRALQPAMLAKRIRLDLQAPDDGPFIDADRDLIFAAVRNIVSNAVKYSRPGAGVCVSVSGDPRSGRAALRVRDVGVGVPAEDLPRVFDKFYRAPAHRQLAQGTGLGLNLVKLVVEQVHGGEVTVRSEPGKGSEFGFSVPLFEQARRRAAPAAKAGEPPKRQDSQGPSATGDNPNPGSEP